MSLSCLLVDDSEEFLVSAAQLLSLQGVQVVGRASSGDEALRLVRRLSPDVALVDFHLKGGELSYGLIASLRARGVPVVMLSGSFEYFPLPSIEGTFMLEKPFSEALLFAHLSRLYAKKSG